MAKSNLTLKSGQAIRLELDFFKLVFAVAKLRADGQQAQGYLQVLNEVSVKRAEGWCKKYDTGDAVIILPTPELTVIQQTELEAEKRSNAAGIVPQSELVKIGNNPSIAQLGKDMGESLLAAQILQLHPTVNEVKIKEQFPHGINWDFYGIV